MQPVDLTIQRNKFKANLFELVIAIFVLLSLMGYAIGFFDIIPSLNGGNPFKDYYSNLGIRIIFVLGLTSRILFLVSFAVLAFKRKGHTPVKVFYLLSALYIGFLQWFELYYGSTFYYGEVRDKQGLMFPMLSLFMITLVIWKIDLPIPERKNFTAKIALTTITIISLYAFWNYVFESWNLWQS